MKTTLKIVAAATLSFSAAGQAATCRAPEANPMAVMNVATPEMRWVEPAPNTCLSAQEIVARARAEAARMVPAATAADGAYKPKTKDDNSPWRFDMNQNGKRMTVEEFAAWMKAKGITVATGKPTGASAAVPAAATEEEKKKKK